MSYNQTELSNNQTTKQNNDKSMFAMTWFSGLGGTAPLNERNKELYRLYQQQKLEIQQNREGPSRYKQSTYYSTYTSTTPQNVNPQGNNNNNSKKLINDQFVLKSNIQQISKIYSSNPSANIQHKKRFSSYHENRKTPERSQVGNGIISSNNNNSNNNNSINLNTNPNLLIPLGSNNNTNNCSNGNNHLTELSLEKKNGFLNCPKTAYGNDQFQNYNPNLQFAYMTYNQAFINLKQQHRVKSQHHSKLHSLSQYQKSTIIKSQQQQQQQQQQPQQQQQQQQQQPQQQSQGQNYSTSIQYKDGKTNENNKIKKQENQPKPQSNKYNNFKRIILNSRELGAQGNGNTNNYANNSINSKNSYNGNIFKLSKQQVNCNRTHNNFNPTYDIGKNINTENSVYNVSEYRVNSCKKENANLNNSGCNFDVKGNSNCNNIVSKPQRIISTNKPESSKRNNLSAIESDSKAIIGSNGSNSNNTTNNNNILNTSQDSCQHSKGNNDNRRISNTGQVQQPQEKPQSSPQQQQQQQQQQQSQQPSLKNTQYQQPQQTLNKNEEKKNKIKYDFYYRNHYKTQSNFTSDMRCSTEVQNNNQDSFDNYQQNSQIITCSVDAQNQKNKKNSYSVMDIGDQYQNLHQKIMNQKNQANNSACQQIVNEEQEYEQVFDELNAQNDSAENKQNTIQQNEESSSKKKNEIDKDLGKDSEKTNQQITHGNSKNNNEKSSPKEENNLQTNNSHQAQNEILIDDDKNKIIKQINESRPDTSEGGRRKRRNYKQLSQNIDQQIKNLNELDKQLTNNNNNDSNQQENIGQPEQISAKELVPDTGNAINYSSFRRSQNKFHPNKNLNTEGDSSNYQFDASRYKQLIQNKKKDNSLQSGQKKSSDQNSQNNNNKQIPIKVILEQAQTIDSSVQQTKKQPYIRVSKEELPKKKLLEQENCQPQHQQFAYTYGNQFFKSQYTNTDDDYNTQEYDENCKCFDNFKIENNQPLNEFIQKKNSISKKDSDDMKYIINSDSDSKNGFEEQIKKAIKEHKENQVPKDSKVNQKNDKESSIQPNNLKGSVSNIRENQFLENNNQKAKIQRLQSCNQGQQKCINSKLDKSNIIIRHNLQSAKKSPKQVNIPFKTSLGTDFLSLFA